RDPVVSTRLNPVLARLAVRLDESPGRRPRDIRIAMPVPARNGEWVVDGWGASRYEPGTTACHDVDVLLATGRVLHAQLDSVVRSRPDALDARTDRWAEAERLVFETPDRIPAIVAGRPAETLVARLLEEFAPVDLGPDQLVHADLAGNVLLDANGAPVVIDVAPYWRPVLWAEAMCALDAVIDFGAPLQATARFTRRPERQALVRAGLFRLLSDLNSDLALYDKALS
ncbi:MAG: aminoglycoside phosphotransferase, partial [Actinomycetota bacterium]|nr:aminoglycoside phosphotransferase [Actinomycetota bacterium]